MILFVAPKKKSWGLIYGKPKGKDILSPRTVIGGTFRGMKAFGAGLNYAGKDFVQGIKEYKESLPKKMSNKELTEYLNKKNKKPKR